MVDIVKSKWSRLSRTNVASVDGALKTFGVNTLCQNVCRDVMTKSLNSIETTNSASKVVKNNLFLR